MNLIQIFLYRMKNRTSLRVMKGVLYNHSKGEKMKNWELEKKETTELNDDWFEDKYIFKPKHDDHFKIRLYISPNGVWETDTLKSYYHISINDIEDINNFIKNTTLKYQK